MAWVPVHQQIANHRKTRELFRRLNVSRQEAIGYLVLIWLWALDNADRDGRLLSTTIDDIEDAGYWSGEPGVLYRALVDSKWIDEKDGSIYLHDWYEFNKPFYQYIDKKEKDKKRKREGNSAEIPSENRTEFHDSYSHSSSHSVFTDDDEETRAREGKVFEFFNQNIGPITPYQSQVISQYIDEGIEPEMIVAVMQDSLGKDDRWSWINRVLQNSILQNIKTLEQYKAKKIERENAKSRDKPKWRGERNAGDKQHNPGNNSQPISGVGIEL